MIAQLVLSALLMGVLFYAWMEYLRSPAVGLALRRRQEEQLAAHQ